MDKAVGLGKERLLEIAIALVSMKEDSQLAAISLTAVDAHHDLLNWLCATQLVTAAHRILPLMEMMQGIVDALMEVNFQFRASISRTC